MAVQYIRVVVMFLAAGIAASTPSIARTQPLVISSDAPVVDLVSQMSAQPAEQAAPGRTRMSVSVVSHDSDTSLWRLSTELLKPATFEIHRSDRPEPILAVDYPHQPHETRASQGRVHTSEPFALTPGQSVELIAYFNRPPDSDDFPISLVSESTLDKQLAMNRYLHGSYIGASAVFLLFFVVFSQLLSSRPARFYAVYYFFLAALALHSYGYTSLVAGDSFSNVYFPAFRFFQISIMLAYIGFAISFIRARHNYRWLFLIARSYTIVSITLLLAEALLFAKAYPLLVQIMALGFLAISIATVIVAIKDRLAGAGLFALGFVVLLINGVVNYIASFAPFFAYNDAVDAGTLALQLIDAFIFAAAIVSQTRGLKRDRDDALQARLVAAEEKLQISEQLRQSERERDSATRLAERHRSRLASTSHDLRQPLSSLKLALRDTQSMSSDVHGKLASGLDYLDSVLDGALDDSMPAQHRHRENPNPTDEYEAVPLQVIFDNIQRMFSSEAADKGLELRIANTTLVADSSAVMLIRVLSNLVANAIKYSDRGTVLLGARRHGNAIALQVWDGGPGMDDATLQRVMMPYQRGDQVDDTIGHGLGLSIVHKLLQQHRLSLEARSTPGAGSVFTVTGIERAKPVR